MANSAGGALAQTVALLRAASRELLWGLRAVSDQVERWREQASAIPDAALREDALAALHSKRGNTDGAALFWTLPPRRDIDLLRLLVAYEIMCDYLDSVSETGAAIGLVNGRQLHLAFTEALDPDTPISDYYRHNPHKDDGGYLRGLVQACRSGCTSLPSYRTVRPILMRAAGRARVQAINHELDPCLREAALRAWASREFPGREDASWFELTGSASTWISVLALLALASEPGRSRSEAIDTYAAYFWVCLTATVLDSYVDQREDLANGDHSYFAHYESATVGVRRGREIVARATSRARALPHGERHATIVACMVSLYLSKDSALTSEMRAGTLSLLRAGGPLALALGPVLRAWRVAYSLRGA